MSNFSGEVAVEILNRIRDGKDTQKMRPDGSWVRSQTKNVKHG